MVQAKLYFSPRVSKPMGKRGPHPIRDLLFWENEWYAIFKGLRDGRPIRLLEELRFEPRRLSRHPDLQKELQYEVPVGIRVGRTKILGIPAERELLEKLLKAGSVPEVRAICGQSKYWLNPRNSGKPFLEALSRSADQFLAAKNDRHFPASKRPSSDDKRLRYLARAMAGITLGRSPRRSIDLLGKGMPRARMVAKQEHGNEPIIEPSWFRYATIKPNHEVVPIN